VVVYTPCGGAVRFAPGTGVQGLVRLVDPRTGEDRVLSATASETVATPDTRDWLLVCGPGWQERA
jgi:hypothetical protein